MNQLGIGLESMAQLISDKYGCDFPEEVIIKDITRLTNQLWKLIPMRENEENWQKQLKTVIIEIVGLNSIFINNLNFLILLSKLEGISTDLSFEEYRKTVFEAINLIQELKHALE